MSQASPFQETPIQNVHHYWNSRPCNIRHSQKPIGTREYFDEVEHRKYKVEPHIPAFAEFPRWEGKRVLEIGCGIGTDTVNFARHGAQVTSIDLTEKSLEVAQQRVKVFGLEDRVKFYQANAEELSTVVPVEPYDLIYSFGVIHHTPSPENALKQMRQYAHPESTLKLMVYNHYSWKALWVLLRWGKGKFWKIRELMAKYSEAQTGCPVTYTYTRGQGRTLLRNCGFRPTETFVDHIFPYRISEYKQYRYSREWYFAMMPRPMFRLLERCFGWHLCLSGVPEV